MYSMVALLVPALGLPLGLLLAEGHGGVPDPFRPGTWPWEMWAMAACGLVATAGGVMDHLYHLGGERTVSPKERGGERQALSLGCALFLLMCWASVRTDPRPLLLPILGLALATTVLVCKDEYLFHRRCKPYETRLHRMLVLGNGAAFLLWCHWVFVR